MFDYTRDGAPIPNHVPINNDWDGIFGKKFGLVRGWVQRAVYPEDDDNQTGFLEYVVTIEGQDYYGVLDLSRAGGILNNHVRVRPDFDPKSSLEGFLPSQFEEKKNCDVVWCLFIKSNGELPIIIGDGSHPRVKENTDYKDPKREDGIFERYEFNGIEFMVDKDSNVSVTHVGRKKITPTGTIPDPASANATTPNKSKIVFKGNGDLSIDINDTLLKMDFLKADSKVDLQLGAGTTVSFDGTNDLVDIKTALGDELSVSAADGIQGTTPSGTSLSMKNGSVDIEGTGAKAKFSGGQVAFGSASGELLDLLDQFMDLTDQTLTDIEAITVPTAVGVSGPPVNSASFVAHQTTLATIKATLGLIKGAL